MNREETLDNRTVYLVSARLRPYWKYQQYLSLVCCCQDATCRDRRRSRLDNQRGPIVQTLFVKSRRERIRGEVGASWLLFTLKEQGRLLRSYCARPPGIS